MQKPIGFIAVLTLAGCAATPSHDQAPRDNRTIVTGGDGATVADVSIRRDDYVQITRVDAPRDTVWALLPSVYEELGLPAPVVEPSSWTVAVQNHAMMRRVGRQRMSSLLECGRDMSGAHADTHRIRLSVRTWLTQAGNSTEVSTRVEASATSVEGRAGSLPCTSRGELERQITNALRARVAVE